jgi:hypothetical protein
MKTLANEHDRCEIRARLLSLTKADEPRWGQMKLTQMLVHLREPFLYALSDQSVVPIRFSISPQMVKTFALQLPIAWPKGLPTVPAYRIDVLQVTSFEEDYAALLAAFDAFCAATSITKDHPFFDTMSHGDWLRWGYLHPDHHLRQFGR